MLRAGSGEEEECFHEALRLSCRCALSRFLVDQKLQCIQPHDSAYARQLPKLQGATDSASTYTKHAG
jgi:hypothetical protein